MNTILTSATAPAGGGLLPRRIVLHLTGNNHTPLATHLEAQSESGVWNRYWGHYFDTKSRHEAVLDYLERCKLEGVEPC